MKIPETYEEFLALSENEIDDISKSDMTLQDAQKMMKFFDRFDIDYQNKPILESSNIVVKKFGDYLK
jgi:hypothetical protein